MLRNIPIVFNGETKHKKNHWKLKMLGFKYFIALLYKGYAFFLKNFLNFI